MGKRPSVIRFHFVKNRAVIPAASAFLFSEIEGKKRRNAKNSSTFYFKETFIYSSISSIGFLRTKEETKSSLSSKEAKYILPH